MNEEKFELEKLKEFCYRRKKISDKNGYAYVKKFANEINNLVDDYLMNDKEIPNYLIKGLEAIQEISDIDFGIKQKAGMLNIGCSFRNKFTGFDLLEAIPYKNPFDVLYNQTDAQILKQIVFPEGATVSVDEPSSFGPHSHTVFKKQTKKEISRRTGLSETLVGDRLEHLEKQKLVRKEEIKENGEKDFAYKMPIAKINASLFAAAIKFTGFTGIEGTEKT